MSACHFRSLPLGFQEFGLSPKFGPIKSVIGPSLSSRQISWFLLAALGFPLLSSRIYFSESTTIFELLFVRNLHHFIFRTGNKIHYCNLRNS